ncbi:TPR domain protein in aerotolerance operon [Vibrio ichthyoenteri ATCC 700023]|uniref:TPR domain protein in aerotolerance operon n=1 Tax=Vibrio ichthyoenteri ATCC 700023 TaxID=870968 RepID=F9S0B3_9VIBR|nr:VWA domain-containing protein [Vibrio ichthyoenteri]EGU43383.1 TPR domain protein in aerotolerance operon [Vibrio ichthyoenteri ATCC 700023]
MFDWQALQQFLVQFHFLRPQWLLALVPMLVLLWLRWRVENKPSWQDVLPSHLRNALTIGETGWKKQLPLKMLIVIMTFAIVICAGPTWQRQASPFGEDKASMLVVLDNTDSMLQKDLPPSRLERAKQKISDLLAARNGGRTGLVVFAGSAHVAMPITQDNEVFSPFLAAITPEIMPIEGKLAEKALPLIDQQLQQQAGSTVLLVSDSVNQQTIRAYKEFFSQRPYQLLVLAAGNPNIVSNDPIDLESLEALTSATNGHLIEVAVDNRDVEMLNRYIERNMQINGESSMPWQDMGYGLLIPIALIMLLWFRKGWLVQWCVIASISATMLVPIKVKAEAISLKAETNQQVETRSTWQKAGQWWWDLWLTSDQQGQRLFNQHQYLEAAKQFRDPLRKGTAYYYAGEYKLAHSAFIQMESDYGLYNAASALARQREYVAARDLLIALLEKPTLTATLKDDVQHNLNVIAGIVEDVNRTSESQAGSTDGPEESLELDQDKPRTGDGVDEETAQQLMQKQQFSADDILADQEVADKWLKRVEADPKYFLRAKFQIQLREPALPQQSSVSSDRAVKADSAVKAQGAKP